MATIDIGKIKPVFKGTYDNSTAYVLDDIVYYNGSSYVAKTSTTGNLPTDTTKWNILASGSGGIWSSTLSLGSANQVVKVNSGGTALEFGAMDSGKTLGVTQYTNNTRTSLPQQDTYSFWDTNYTQIKANSKLIIDVNIIGHTNNNGAVNFDFEYDGTTYSGFGGYTYESSGNFKSFTYRRMIDGASSTGAKNFKYQYDHANNSNGSPFSVWNPNATDDNRLQQTVSTLIITEMDF